MSGKKRPYGHFEPADRLASEGEFEAEEVDGLSVGYDSDPKVVSSAWPGRGSAVSYPVHSAPPPKKSCAREHPEVVCLSDSDTSKAASVATTRSAQSVRATGLAASAEDHCLGLDARRNVPDHFVHRSMAAAVAGRPLPQKRDELHPAHPHIAKRQVRRSECSM